MEQVPPTTRGRRKDVGKRDAIILAARALFLERGFAGTSMECLAGVARVSKATLYSHFADKNALYRAIIEDKVMDYRLADFSELLCGDMRRDLELIAVSLQDLLFDDEAVAMVRMVISEARQQSPLVKIFEEAGPGRVFARIADYFESCKQRGEPGLGCPHDEASLFTDLVIGHRKFMRVLMNIEKVPKAAARKKNAHEAVSTFLALKKH
ncbi:TetR/AcrR family transcriptional regulator [Alphaproteobacteria bacterium]|nr:TetR/AcrR family transcriptional regulator [Alphaproteobacteria bacterium]